MDNIKSMLEKGYSAEDLRVMLENEINAANESIEKERAAATKSTLTEPRKAFIDALNSYVESVTGNKMIWTEDAWPFMNDMFEDFENLAKRYTMFSDFEKELYEKGKAEKHYHTDNMDTILKGIIKRL